MAERNKAYNPKAYINIKDVNRSQFPKGIFFDLNKEKKKAIVSVEKYSSKSLT